MYWTAVFQLSGQKALTSGLHVFTVSAGDFSRDISFNVTGNELVANAFSIPNPFSGETNIVYSFNLAVESVTIDIYNVSGVLIRSLDPPPAGSGPRASRGLTPSSGTGATSPGTASRTARTST